MADFSILYFDYSSKDTIELSPTYIDFNIDRIMKEIEAYWREDVSALYRYFPFEEAGQEYRKAIYTDICREGMYEILMEFRDEMKNRTQILSEKEKTRFPSQQAVMTLGEIRSYVTAVDTLNRKLSQSEITSEGMRELAKLVQNYVEGNPFTQLREKSAALRASLSAIPIKLSYRDRHIYVSFEEVEGNYDTFLRGFSAPNSVDMKETEATAAQFFKGKNPFGDSVEITLIEQEVFEIVCKKYPEIFRDLAGFVKESVGYAEDFVLKFSEEIPFYLSFYTFQKAMERKGLHFCMAESAQNNCLHAEELYDLALACQLVQKEEIPVSNDVRLEADENFFVLTGPNQGGKTTFARSLGQLVYFSKLGLPVPAKSAAVPFYSRILTHFSVEESIETGKGKLAEELTRLAPMMADKDKKNDFVVINELFTTAANYDACIMGKRVLDHFIRQNCHGIYVTHLQDLSKEDPGIVSLRAMMNEEHRQNFKIVRSTEPALESSILLVEKHQLHYEQVMNRLKGGEA